MFYSSLHNDRSVAKNSTMWLSVSADRLRRLWVRGLWVFWAPVSCIAVEIKTYRFALREDSECACDGSGTLKWLSWPFCARKSQLTVKKVPWGCSVCVGKLQDTGAQNKKRSKQPRRGAPKSCLALLGNRSVVKFYLSFQEWFIQFSTHKLA